MIYVYCSIKEPAISLQHTIDGKIVVLSQSSALLSPIMEEFSGLFTPEFVPLPQKNCGNFDRWPKPSQI